MLDSSVKGENGAIAYLSQFKGVYAEILAKYWTRAQAEISNPLKNLASPTGFEPVLPP